MFGPIRPFLATPLLLATAVIARGQETPDVRLDVGSPAGATASSFPEVAAVGSAVYVVWQDDRNGESDVYFNRSLDGGASWLASDLRLDVGSAPGASSSGFPRIAASGSAVYVVWQDDRNGEHDIYFNRSLDGGASWLASDRRLDVGSTPGAAGSGGPRLAASGNSVFVAWVDVRSGLNVYFNRSLDGGASWLASDVRLDAAGGGVAAEEPEIAASGAAVYVTWKQWDFGGEDIYLDRSLDGGATWLSSDARLSVGRPPLSASAGQPQIAASSAAVYVTYWDNRDGEPDVYFNRSLDGGATWLGADTRLDLGSPPGAAGSGVGFGFPALGIAASGPSVFVAWADSRFGTREAVFFNRSLDAGTSWLDPDVRLDTGSTQGYSRYPRIAAEGPSVHVIWREEMLGSVGDVQFQRSIDAGDSWLAEPVRLNVGVAPRTTSVAFPELAASGSSVYAVWDDYRNGEADVYFDLALGFQPYGQGTNSSGGIVPTIAGSGNPSIGATFSLEIARGTGGAAGYVLAGTNGPAAGRFCVSPPLQAIPFQLGGSKGVPGAGSASIAIPVPDDPLLIGTRVNFQARIFDAATKARTDRNVTLTGGLETWIL